MKRTSTLTFTEEDKKILFRMIKLAGKMHHKGEFPLTKEEWTFIYGKLMLLY